MLKQTLFNLDIKILTLIIEEDQTIPFNQVKTKPQQIGEDCYYKDRGKDKYRDKDKYKDKDRD